MSYKKADKSHSAFDRNLLAISLSIKHFCYFQGRPFSDEKHHKSWTFTIPVANLGTSLEQPLVIYCRVQRISADALSRASVNETGTAVPLSLDFANTAALQKDNPDAHAKCSSTTGLCFQDIPVPGSNYTCCVISLCIFCDQSFRIYHFILF